MTALHEAQTLARALMDEHGLHDWRFAFNRRKLALGVCSFEKRTIFLSAPLVEMGNDPRDTILHEIAHALVGIKAGHGPVWKRKAREIGANPEAENDAVMVPGRYRITCQCGEIEMYRYKAPKRGWSGYTVQCRSCGKSELVVTDTQGEIGAAA